MSAREHARRTQPTDARAPRTALRVALLAGASVVAPVGGARAEAPVAPPAASAPAPNPPRVDAEVRTRSDRGQVFCSIFAAANAGAYPTRAERAEARAIVPVREGRAVCSFSVPPGDYAIAVFHDENGNGRLDTGIFGIPTEGTGASNDARGTFGPPSFADARFTYRGGVASVRVRVRY